MQPLPAAHAFGHCVAAQLCWPVHVTSHAHALRQSTSLHDSEPVHEIAQSPPLQLTFSHDFAPEHSITHEAAFAQLTSRHASAPQLIVQ